MPQRPAGDTRWDPRQYLKFSDHRLRPGLELLDRVAMESPAVIYDLGCGSGQITRLMRETLVTGGPEGGALGSEELRQTVARKWVEDAQVYYDLLVGCTRSLDIWETEYLQVLEGENAVLEWVKGTGLRPILNGLDDAEREAFLRQYTQRLHEAYPLRADGSTLYPFRRLFLVATAR